MYDELASGRLKDYFHPRTPWQRSLWGVGTLVGLDEVLESAAVGAQGGSNTNEYLKWICGSMKAQVLRDVGLGAPPIRDAINDLLGVWANLKDAKKDWPDDRDLARLAEYRTRAQAGYIERWAEAAGEEDKPSVELLARCVAPHMLDVGFSADFLDDWYNERLGDPIVDTLRDAESLLCEPPKEWTVLVPLLRMPERLVVPGGPWVSATETVAWLEGEGWTSGTGRIMGGLVYTAEARDPITVARKALEVIARTDARVQTGFRTEKALTRGTWAAIQGQPNEPVKLREARRKVEVPYLLMNGRLGQIRTDDASVAFDDAIELASQMLLASPGAAITGGWAAIEGLLARSTEKGKDAADRAAALTCCSWAKAEMQTLGHRRAQSDDALGERLRDLRGSHRKAAELYQLIASGDEITWTKANDRAAYLRMREVIADPASVMPRVYRYMQNAFRRLYTQRNLIMHAGSLQSAALPTTMRTLPPLVGAALDRVAYGLYGPKPTDPLHLSARAEVELSHVGDAGGRSVLDLLYGV